MYVVVVAVCLGVFGPSLGQELPPPIYRLKNDTSPVSYYLRLAPNITAGTVEGEMLVDIMTTSNKSARLSSITMHCGPNVNVNLTSCLIFNETTVLHPGAIVLDDVNSLMTLKLTNPVKLDHGKLYMMSCKFTSLLNSEPKGLFTGSYNSTSQYIASNFRPTHARNVFPCYDEPQFKVPITLQIVRTATQRAFSTAPLLNSTSPDENNMVMDTFDATDPISVHYLGIFITEVQPVDAMGMQVFAPPSLDPAPYLNHVIDNITQLLGPMPTPMNLIVLPDHVHTTFSSLGFVFVSSDVFTGQLPHRFDLVPLELQFTESFLRQYFEYTKTPAWWSDIWLSDAIAAFLSVSVQPEQASWVAITKAITRSESLRKDFYYYTPSLVNSNLLSRYDIENAVSNMTIRNKGLSVLTMWNDTLPEGLVIDTILQYLKLNKTVVTTGDLFDIMLKNIISNEKYNVTDAGLLLGVWLNQPGSPTMSYHPQSTTSFMLSQAAGCAHDNSSGVPSSPIWPLSVSYTTDKSPDWQFYGHYSQAPWLLTSNGNFSFSNDTAMNKWIVFNLETAPYRMDYGDSWDGVVYALQKDLTPAAGVPDTVRAMLQDDAMALSLAGCIPFSVPLAVMKATSRQQLDWFPVAKFLSTLNNMIADDSVHDQLMVFAGSLFSPQLLSQLDVANSSLNTELQEVRAQLTPWLCRFNIGNCRQSVLTLSQPLWTGNTSLIADSDVENVACYGARYSGSSPLQTLMDVYRTTAGAGLRRVYATAISCISDQPSVNSTLYTLISSTSPFSLTDSKHILMGLASQLENSETILDFIVNNIQTLQDGMGVLTTSNLINSLANLRVNLDKLENLKNESISFDPYVMQTIDASMDKAAANAAWWSANKASLSAALPQAPTTAPPTAGPTTGRPSPGPSPSPTPTPHPSGADRLANIHGISLLLAVMVSVFIHF